VDVSAFSPLDSLVPSVAGQPVLVLDGDSGYVLTLPSLPERLQVKERLNLYFKIKEDGSARCEGEYLLPGSISGRYRNALKRRMGPRERALWVERNANAWVPGIRVSRWEITEFDIYEDGLKVSFSGMVDGLLQPSGGGFRFRPLRPLRVRWLMQETYRRLPLRIQFYGGVDDESTVRIEFPSSFRCQAPEPCLLSTVFGCYALSVRGDSPNCLTIVRTFQLRDGDIPPEKYEQFVSFLRRVQEAESRSVYLERKR
jgi:hypothetical protein